MPDDIGTLLREIHRRSLWQMLSVYVIGAWLVYEVAVTLYEGLGLPDWVPPTAVTLLLLGLPLVLATAFVQEGPPKLGAENGADEASRARGTVDADDPVRAQRVAAADHPGEAGVGPGPAPSSLFTWRKTVTAVVLGFAGLGLAASGFMGMRALGIGPAATLVSSGELARQATIVLADFENATPDSLLAGAVREALRMDLTESPVISLASTTTITEVLDRMLEEPTTPLTADVAREIAVRQGWPAVLTGGVSKIGNRYTITAELLTADSGRVLAGFREAAPRDGVLEAIDRLSAEIREKVGESLRSIRDGRPLPEATTASLEALRAYAAGRAKEAVAIDSTFARAWYNLAINYGRTGYSRAREVDAARRAYRLRNRLNPVERGHVTGVYHLNVTGDWGAAADAYGSVLAIHPNDQQAVTNRGVALTMMRDYPRAQAAHGRSVEVNPSNALCRFNLAGILYAQGKTDSALAVLNQPDSMLTYPMWTERMKAELAINEGDFERARRQLDSVRAVTPGLFTMASYQATVIEADLNAIQGRVRDAVRQTWSLGEGARRVGLVPVRIAHAAEAVLILAHAGLDATAALDTLDAFRHELGLENTAPLANPYGILAEAYATAGRVDEAEAQLAGFDAVNAEIGTSLTDANRYRVARARGILALRAGDPERALRALRPGDVPCTTDEWTLPGLCFDALIGLAHEEAGRPDSAIAAYERYLAARTNRRHTIDAVHLATVLEHLGALHEARGDRERAAGYYARFIELWKDADPELQYRVQAARRALSRLSAEG